ncbi:hypothetical protein [Mycobacterium marinum]|uniref:hypothetical protein n=1 Tax=Mycobacterium marinum TaxID=1781 RepID=UPI00045FD789|nr:hypothetical protein [Mycobacterium marinum]CDM78557.1 hypothetical protein MMARE11_44200 [Mycobacterium marinum E11]
MAFVVVGVAGTESLGVMPSGLVPGGITFLTPVAALAPRLNCVGGVIVALIISSDEMRAQRVA